MSEYKRLEGKKVIVVGGASGIGAACAKMMASEGADVAVVDLDGELASGVASELVELGHVCFSFQMDVRDHRGMQEAIDKAAEQLEGLDVLVNSAGIPEYKYFWEIEEEMWDRMIAVNLKGVYNGMAAAVGKMKDNSYGRVINISSVGGIIGTQLHSHYSAAKAGVIGLSKATAKELAPDNITVNVVAPGLIETPLTDNISPGPWKQMVIEKTPMGRIGKVEEIAASVVFLASDDASFITGQVISPNGGYVM